jgi:hypothetical protein
MLNGRRKLSFYEIGVYLFKGTMGRAKGQERKGFPPMTIEVIRISRQFVRGHFSGREGSSCKSHYEACSHA